MKEQMYNINRKRKILRKTKEEMLQIKNTVTELPMKSGLREKGDNLSLNLKSFIHP